MSKTKLLQEKERCPLCGQPIAPVVGLKFDPESNCAVVDGMLVAMTRHEADLLDYLISIMPRVATKEQILDHLYPISTDQSPEPKIIDVYVCKLRKELKGTNLTIKTHWGRGYSAQYLGGGHGG